MILGDDMKTVIKITIFVLALAGVVINVLASTFEDPVSLVRGLSIIKYFTIQSNMLVATYFLYLIIGKRNNKLDKQILGVSVNITITFIIYALMLAHTWDPKGWHQVSNILLHYITPIITVIYLLTYNEVRDFKYSDILYMMIYPLLYLLFLVTHGIITGDYLYPFFQVSEVGIFGLISMIFGLVVFFVLLSISFMKIVSLKENQNID